MLHAPGSQGFDFGYEVSSVSRKIKWEQSTRFAFRVLRGHFSQTSISVIPLRDWPA